ncbi:glycosyltransferase family protein, partial [Psychrobacter sp. 1Y10]
LPTTNYQLPTTNYQLPTTNYQLPTTKEQCMVLFLISNYAGFNTGRGGHYYSLRQMAESIAESRKVVTIVLGEEMPLALVGMKDTYHISTELHLQRKGLNDAINKLKTLNFLYKLTTVHAYDAKSVYIGAHIAKNIKASFLLTKCGGKVPKKFYPKVNTLVVFHEEDYNHFYNYKNNYQNLYLIPNRVKPALYLEERQNQIESLREDDAFHVTKIGRIGSYYYKTLIAAIRFCAEIQSHDYPVKLTFIGYEESEDITKQLNIFAQELNVKLTIHSDSNYTSNASELIWACDIAVGTGRGAMEALSAGKILLFPVTNFDYPCLFNDKTAFYAMHDNFSERVKLPNELLKYCDPNYIKSLLSDKAYRQSLKTFGYNTFHTSFNVDVGAKKVMAIYDNERNIRPVSGWHLLRLRLHYIKLSFKYRTKSFRYRLKRLIRL